MRTWRRSSSRARSRITRIHSPPTLSRSYLASQCKPTEARDWLPAESAAVDTERGESSGQKRTAEFPEDFVRIVQVGNGQGLFPMLLTVVGPEGDGLVVRGGDQVP